ncbi:MAG TPA: YggT family protein [Steroidobacteraceae bacterium]|nr:YggT family protein [Steroidobacteraceae bacterium]
MAALIYIVDTLCSLYIGLYILRFLMQLVRADFRNEVSAAIVKLTNPLILPLRRVLPPVGKIDSASVVAILLLTAGKIALLRLMAGFPLPTLVGWIWLLVFTVIVDVLWVLFWCIVLSALISLLTQGARTVITYLLDAICEPVLRPFRRYIPSLVSGFDLSYLWATIAIQALIILINSTFLPRF